MKEKPCCEACEDVVLAMRKGELRCTNPSCSCHSEKNDAPEWKERFKDRFSGPKGSLYGWQMTAIKEFVAQEKARSYEEGTHKWQLRQEVQNQYFDAGKKAGIAACVKEVKKMLDEEDDQFVEEILSDLLTRIKAL